MPPSENKRPMNKNSSSFQSPCSDKAGSERGRGSNLSCVEVAWPGVEPWYRAELSHEQELEPSQAGFPPPTGSREQSGQRAIGPQLYWPVLARQVVGDAPHIALKAEGACGTQWAVVYIPVWPNGRLAWNGYFLNFGDRGYQNCPLGPVGRVDSGD